MFFLYRRIKRWVQEKQQREKNVPGRRHRHKSVGDVENSSKSKRQQQMISQVMFLYFLDLYTIFHLFFYIIF